MYAANIVLGIIDVIAEFETLTKNVAARRMAILVNISHMGFMYQRLFHID
jgi:hypothetical protein